MDVLQKSINVLSKKEIVNYKIYTKRIDSSENRKDILLFDLLKKQQLSDSNSDELFKKLYSKKGSKNTYNKLKSRLLNEVDNSLVQFYFHETDATFIYSELSLYKIYLSKNEWDVAHYHLYKAEKKAIAIQDFVTLDVIYTELIHLSTYYAKVSPTVYIQKRKENNNQLQHLRMLEDALATIVYDLDRSQNQGKANKSTLSVLRKAIAFLNSKKEFKHNLVFKNKLFNSISQLLLSQKDYEALELYAIKTYNEFLKKGYFSKHNHELKLQILRYICNCLFINKKHDLALNYIKELKASMAEFKNMLYAQNIFYYYNTLANNYSVLDPEKAITVLSEAKAIPAIINHPSHLSYIYLNLAGAHFDLKQYKFALKNVLNLYAHPSFETLDVSLKIQIIIMEIILRIESAHVELAQKLIKSLLNNTDYKKIVQTSDYKAMIEFLTALKLLLQKPDFKLTIKNAEYVKQFYLTHKKKPSIGFFNYMKWFGEKFKL